MNEIQLRQAQDKDIEYIKNVVRAAFFREGKDEFFNEWEFTDRVRFDCGFLPKLCLIATLNSEVIGYILLSKATISDSHGLALAPIAVSPAHQRIGIGKKLIKEGIKRAQELGYQWIALTGGNYYFQFGFEDACKYNIILAPNHPENPFLKIMFLNDVNNEISGTMRFCESFYNSKGELL